MSIILYSTGCPKCNVLKKKLDASGISYVVNDDSEIMKQLGFTQVPVLEVDGIYMQFKEANDWINNHGGQK